jgi:outer membrane protein OmpA-like peptidoglycan-associated protein
MRGGVRGYPEQAGVNGNSTWRAKMTRSTKVFASSLFGAGLALSALAGPLAAQDATYLSPEASHCEIFRAISSELPRHCAEPGASLFEPAEDHVRTRSFKTRSIRMHDEPKPVASARPSRPAGVVQAAASAETAVEVEPQSAPAARKSDEGKAFAMPIQFEFDSFRLTEAAMVTLDKVASVLNDELMQGKAIQIEGHADATGSDDYNLSLSQLRARAVRAYLIQEHGVAPERLSFVGKGESEPYDASDPTAGINRRVEFTNLG